MVFIVVRVDANSVTHLELALWLGLRRKGEVSGRPGTRSASMVSIFPESFLVPTDLTPLDILAYQEQNDIAPGQLRI